MGKEEQRTRVFLISEFENEYYLYLRSNGRSEATIGFYRDKIRSWLRWCSAHGARELPELTPGLLRAFLTEYREEHSTGGAHSYYRAIKAYLNWIWYDYDIEMPNPIGKVKCPNRQPGPIPGVQTEDVEKLFEAAKKGLLPERDCAILAILLDTGIRLSSLYHIRKGDIDLQTGRILLQHTKNGSLQTVFLGRRGRMYVRSLLRSLPCDLPEDATIWYKQDGEPMEIGNFRRILDRITERAGTESYSPHDFRRFFALESWRNGADLYAVSVMMGHRGTEVTRRYLAVNEEDTRAVHSRTSPLDQKKKGPR